MLTHALNLILLLTVNLCYFYETLTASSVGVKSADIKISSAVLHINSS
jgi:hypothetical protein